VRDVFVTYRRVGEIFKVVFEARFRRAPEIEDDFNNLFDIVKTDERLPYREWKDVEELREFPTGGDLMNSNRQSRPPLSRLLPMAPLRSLGPASGHSFTTRMTRSLSSYGP